MLGHLVVLLAQGVELLLPGHGVPPGVGPTLRQVLDMKILQRHSRYDGEAKDFYFISLVFCVDCLSYLVCSSSEAFQTFI